MRRKQSIILFLCILAISGCAAKTGNQFLEKTSSEELSKKLIANSTTKNDVKEMFGDPMTITFMASNNEMWSYSFVRSEAKMINLVPMVNLFYAGSNDNIRSLHIIFNPDNIVNSFNFINSDGETKIGLFQ